MASQNITLTDDTVLCEYVPLEQFKSFLGARLGVGPDLLALLIRDGQIVHAGHGGHFSVGGVWRSIKDVVAGTHALKLLVADLKPFRADGGFSAMTRDNVMVRGEVSLELQVNPDAPQGVLAFASDSEVVLKATMFDRLAPHINDRVLGHVVRKVDALALRGDVDVQNKVQAEILSEAERIFGDMGLLVRAVSVNWAFNEEELAEMQKRAERREQEMLDAKLENFQREIGRSATVTDLQITTELSTDKLRETSDAELRTLIMTQEVDFVDAKETAAREQRMKALEGEVAELVREQEARLDMQMTDAKAAAALNLQNVEAQLAVEKVQAQVDEFARKRVRLDTEQSLALDKLRELQRLEIAAKARQEQMASLRGMQDLELDGADRKVDIENKALDADHRRRMDEIRQRDDKELAELRLQREMTPDQILAIQAGLSPDVARVFAERARAEDQSAQEKMQLMERLVASGAQTSAQALQFFREFKEGVIGVADGAGPGGSNDAPATVLCPACRTENPASAAFCSACSAPLR